jgi:hypothetical protein
LNAPAAIAVDADGHVLIADSRNNRVRRVDRATGIITTVAGDGRDTMDRFLNNVRATAVSLFSLPQWLAKHVLMPRRTRSLLLIRDANESDIRVIESMVADFVKGDPSENHPRSSQALRAAYFSERPVAHMLIAERNGQIVGMAQWTLIYDMFWGMFGAEAALHNAARHSRRRWNHFYKRGARIQRPPFLPATVRCFSLL